MVSFGLLAACFAALLWERDRSGPAGLRRPGRAASAVHARRSASAGAVSGAGGCGAALGNCWPTQDRQPGGESEGTAGRTAAADWLRARTGCRERFLPLSLVGVGIDYALDLQLFLAFF